MIGCIKVPASTHVAFISAVSVPDFIDQQVLLAQVKGEFIQHRDCSHILHNPGSTSYCPIQMHCVHVAQVTGSHVQALDVGVCTVSNTLQILLCPHSRSRAHVYKRGGMDPSSVYSEPSPPGSRTIIHEGTRG